MNDFVEPRFPSTHRASIYRQRAALATLDVARLAKKLAAHVQGEVRFDDGSRALWAADASNYRQVPIGVVLPRTVEDMMATVAICREFNAPVLPRGGGTSLAGQCCNAAVIMDTSKYLRRVIDIDPGQKLARVEVGTVLDDVRDAAETYGLTFGPDPSTHRHCTLGGMLGNNSCGVRSVLAGRTSDNVHSLDILTYDGEHMSVGRTSDEELRDILAQRNRRAEIYRRLTSIRERFQDIIRQRYPQIPRRISGYNLPALLPENGFDVAKSLVGSEGTCVTILEATVQLIDSPKVRWVVALGYDDVFRAAADVPRVMEFCPMGLEAMDGTLVDNIRRKGMLPNELKLLPEGEGWLLVELGGETKQEVGEVCRRLVSTLERGSRSVRVRVFESEAEQTAVWSVREAGLGATARVPGERDTWEGWEDSAVHPENLADYLRDFQNLLDRYGYRGALYGHFGDGCVHTRVSFDLKTAHGVKKFRQFVEEAADTVLRYGGSFSGEHGDGQARGELLHKMFGVELMRAFREFKAVWDPDNKMNPGKLVDAYKITDNLRFGPSYATPPLQTYFEFPDDQGSFATATERCVGVGECRRTETGIMCPSYMVTLEEQHTTRGRAHLLHEMLRGDPLKKGWRNEAVKESLDLCLSCKGCKTQCPLSVDTATYKSEFLAHYYENRVRPRSAYAFGLIRHWARLASWMPEFANFMASTAPFSQGLKWAADIAPERQLPRFAKQTFQQWYRRSPQDNQQRKARVLLWPDTFNNYFRPETAIAAYRVLSDVGFHVVVPQGALCCGRPLYDFGMLGQARHWLQEILHVLEPELRAGTPIVGLEPSCVAVFRDELRNLFPKDGSATRLREHTFTLAEFLEQKAPHYSPPKIARKAMVQAHCHHATVIGFNAERRLLERQGLDVHVLDSGCCGMAGAFGFERHKYDVSTRVGERVLLPAVRAAPPDTIIIADGFSCREQIAQGSHREALHTAEVLRLSSDERPLSRGQPPEATLQLSRKQAALGAGSGGRGVGIAVIACAVVGTAIWLRARRT